MGALSVTHDPHYREPFQPLIGPVTFVDPNRPRRWQAAVTNKTAAIIAEPIRVRAASATCPRASCRR
jgi:acetylornithine/succinyldiaminopimelate/putrescine aminotransferase